MNVKAQVTEMSTTTVNLKGYRVAVWGNAGKPAEGVAVRLVDSDTFDLVKEGGSTERFWYSNTFTVELRPMDYDW